ncbi:MAG TPA: hypothetical protein VK049_06840 [Paenalcaligenes sp.]|nr:hypothetical protein [Paenalcaligenes sp.]
MRDLFFFLALSSFPFFLSLLPSFSFFFLFLLSSFFYLFLLSFLLSFLLILPSNPAFPLFRPYYFVSYFPRCLTPVLFFSVCAAFFLVFIFTGVLIRRWGKAVGMSPSSPSNAGRLMGLCLSWGGFLGDISHFPQ